MTGTIPLLMHSSRLADPLNPIARAIKTVSGKRIKSEEDYEEMARLEHGGSLYFDADLGPFIPADNIWRALYDGAKKSKQGPRMKEGVFITSDVNQLEYNGPRTVDGLWMDKNYCHTASVKVGTSRVQRTRPIFPNWKVSAYGVLDTEQLDLEGLKQIANTAGALIGLGDWRPRFGRFNATVTKG
jgi:hypothetical protein